MYFFAIFCMPWSLWGKKKPFAVPKKLFELPKLLYWILVCALLSQQWWISNREVISFLTWGRHVLDMRLSRSLDEVVKFFSCFVYYSTELFNAITFILILGGHSILPCLLKYLAAQVVMELPGCPPLARVWPPPQLSSIWETSCKYVTMWRGLGHYNLATGSGLKPWRLYVCFQRLFLFIWYFKVSLCDKVLVYISAVCLLQVGLLKPIYRGFKIRMK